MAEQNIYIDTSEPVSGDWSISNPYNAWSDLNWTTGGSNSIFDFIAAGDPVFINIKGTFSTQLGVAGSGTVNAAITIRSYGGVQSLISVASNNAMNIDGRSYVVVDDIEIDGNSLASGGIRLVNSNNITIKNSKIHDILLNGGIRGISAGNGENIRIYNLEVYDCLNDGILISLLSGYVNSCNVYDNFGSAIRAIDSTGLVTVSGNVVTNNGTTGNNHDGIFCGNSSGATFYIYENYISNQLGQSGIDCGNGPGDTTSTFYIYLNRSFDSEERGIAAGDSDAADNVYIYFNLIIGAKYGIAPRSLGVYYIYNNTLVTNNTDNRSGIFNTFSTVRSLTIKNNIIQGYNTAYNIETPNLTIDVDYNYYYDQVVAMANVDSLNKNFTEWKAIVSGDSNSFEQDPEITDSGRLLIGSPCVQSGVIVTGINNNSQADIWGNMASDPPNIGADFRILENPVQISSSQWTAITEPGESGACWKNTGGTIVIDHTDQEIKDILEITNTNVSIDKSKRIPLDKDNGETLGIGADNSDDRFYALALDNNESNKLGVD